MLLREPHTDGLADDSGETEALEPQEAGRHLCVEQSVRLHIEIGEAGEVLGRGVQDPLGASEHVVECAEVSERFRVDEDRARTLAPELNEERPLTVAVPRSPLRVDGD